MQGLDLRAQSPMNCNEVGSVGECIARESFAIPLRTDFPLPDAAHGIALIYDARQAPTRRWLASALDGSSALTLAPFDEGASEAQSATSGGSGEAYPLVAELIRDGASFDLCAASDGLEALWPALNRVYLNAETGKAEDAQLRLLKAGPHVAAARGKLTLIKRQMGAALALAQLNPAPFAIAWTPSMIVVQPAQFASWVSAWVEGGPMPSLLLCAVGQTLDGAVQTRGLNFLTGQEIRIEPDLFDDPDEAGRLALLLFDRYARHGKLSEGEVLTGLRGERLAATPSKNGRFIRVDRS